MHVRVKKKCVVGQSLRWYWEVHNTQLAVRRLVTRNSKSKVWLCIYKLLISHQKVAECEHARHMLERRRWIIARQMYLSPIESSYTPISKRNLFLIKTKTLNHLNILLPPMIPTLMLTAFCYFDYLFTAPIAYCSGRRGMMNVNTVKLLVETGVNI